jgi:hypothetical protein
MITIDPVPPELDILAKLYELWDLEEIKLEPKAAEFILALSEIVYSADKPRDYAFTDAERTCLEKYWKQYGEP